MEPAKQDFLSYYNLYKDKIYNYFWYRLEFKRDLAEDLTSEVFIKALTSFDRFDPAGSFQAWIYTIARNHFLNYCRTSSREVPLEKAVSIKADCLEKIEFGMEMEKVIIAINELDEYSREVLLLKFVDNFDNKEIARVLGKEEGAVRTQISRALVNLRKIIKYE